MASQLRNLLAVATLGATLVAFSGCAVPSGDASSSSTPTADATSAAAALVPDEIKERGYVIVATDAQWGAPTNYHPDGDSTQWAGVEHDLLEAMEPILGVEFRQEDAAFTSIITGVTSGRYDLGVSGFQDTVERQEVVDMVDYMRGGGNTLIVKVGNPEDIHDYADMCGRTMGVVSGSIDETFWSDYSASDCDADEQIEILTFADRPAALLALDSDRIVAATGSGAFSLNLTYNWDGAQSANQGKFEVLLDEIEYGISELPAAFVAPKGDDSIRDAVLAALQELMDSGEFYTIMDEWHYPDEWLWDSPQLNAATE
ncbi:MAG: transporter substrate-binding domain-containing protein [Microbacterium sp.]